MRLSEKQRDLLLLVVSPRHRVTFSHYMGNFRPNERVVVYDDETRRRPDSSFKPTTVYALHDRKLVHFRPMHPGFSTIEATPEGERLALSLRAVGRG